MSLRKFTSITALILITALMICALSACGAPAVDKESAVESAPIASPLACPIASPSARPIAFPSALSLSDSNSRTFPPIISPIPFRTLSSSRKI